MAISPASLSSSASLLQDIRSSQSSASKSGFNSIIEQKGAEKSASVAAQIKSKSADKLSQKIDIQIGDDKKDEKKQLNLTQSFKREAPLASSYQTQRPGSVLDISV